MARWGNQVDEERRGHGATNAAESAAGDAADGTFYGPKNATKMGGMGNLQDMMKQLGGMDMSQMQKIMGGGGGPDMGAMMKMMGGGGGGMGMGGSRRRKD